MCGAFAGHSQTRIAPVTDLTSERVEIRRDRWLRVVHYTPPRLSTDSGNHEETQSLSNNSATGTVDSDYKNIIVIFFIHGVGGSADLWYDQLNYFCRAGYEVVAPDLLGHGGSSAPRNPTDYEFRELCFDMIYLFDRYQKKRNILVGHSYGSSFCTVIASERSRLVSKMVLIAGGGPLPLGVDSCDVFCLPAPMLSCIKPAFLCVYERRAYNSLRARSMKKRRKAFSAPPHVLKNIMAGQRWEEGDESYHQELMVPVLLIYGAQDKFVTLEEEQWMHEVIYSSTLEVIQDAGHMVMVECPVRVNWLIHNFLQRDPTTRSTSQRNGLSSRGSIHVVADSETFLSKKASGALHSVSEQSLEHETRRHSSGVSLQPLNESLNNVRKGSSASLCVPGNVGSRKSLSGSIENTQGSSHQASREIRLEIPQVEDTTNEIGISSKESNDCSNPSTQETMHDKERINPVVISSLNPTLETVRVMSPLAGVAWTENSVKKRSNSHTPLRSFLTPRIQRKGQHNGGTRSVPSSPVSKRPEHKSVL